MSDLELLTAKSALTLKKEGDKITIVRIQGGFYSKTTKLIKDIPDAIRSFNVQKAALGELQEVIEQTRTAHKKLAGKLEGGDWKLADEVAQLESKLGSYEKAIGGLEKNQGNARAQLNLLCAEADQMLEQLWGLFCPLWFQEEAKLLNEIFEPSEALNMRGLTKQFHLRSSCIRSLRTNGYPNIYSDQDIINILQKMAQLLGKIKEGPLDI